MDLTTMYAEIDRLVSLAIREDITDPEGLIPTGDHSSRACFPHPKPSAARLLVKAEGVLAGVEMAKLVCRQVDPALRVEVHIQDGEAIRHGDIVMHVYGDEKSILQAERLLLNYMQRMSGIATHTARFVAAVDGTGVRILDTRKTTPGLRVLEKWAVRLGGGHNHRFGLYDMIMLKDNHIDYCGGIRPAIMAVHKYQQEQGLSLQVEVETRSLDDIKEVMDTGHVHRIMFDNFSPDMIGRAVELVGGRYETEVSGGITLDTIRPYAEAGPDFISVGALTHSSRSLDLSLKAMKA